MNRRFSVYPLTVFVLVALLSAAVLLMSIGNAAAQEGYIDLIRTIDTADMGIGNIRGMAYSQAEGDFLLFDGQNVARMDSVERYLGTSQAALAEPELNNLAWDASTNSIITMSSDQLQQLQISGSGATLQTYAAPATLQGSYQGLAVDPASGDIYLLDAAGMSLLHLPKGSQAYSPIALELPTGAQASKLAINPENEHLYTLDIANAKIYEIDLTGKLIQTLDISAFGLKDPSALVFAPSGDQTDDPAEMSLYTADGTAIYELTLTATVAPAAVEGTISLANIIDTSVWNPPSPDPAGLYYNSITKRLMMTDSEVDEMSIFKGKNFYEFSVDGTLQSTCDLTTFTHEPTGFALDEASGTAFISDDVKDEVFVVDLGKDKTFCTNDDTVTSFDTLIFGSQDSEGLGFGQGKLFIGGGINNEVYVVDPGKNGKFDGVDDKVTHWDTEVLNLLDLQGVTYYKERGTLMLSSNKNNKLAETTVDGKLLNYFNLFTYQLERPAGVAIAPASNNPNKLNVYLADRGVDNMQDPKENDGQIYEFAVTLDPIPGPAPEPNYFLYLPLITR